MVILFFLAMVIIALLVDLAIAWVFAHWLLDTVPYLMAFGTEDWFRVIVALSILGIVGAAGSKARS